LNNKPLILLTCGDPNGIGPEIALRILNLSHLKSIAEIHVIGPAGVFDYYSKKLCIKKPDNGKFLFLSGFERYKIKEGREDKTAGRISGDAVRIAAELCMSGRYGAIVTLPISKKALNLGGYNYNGHTEMLQHITGARETAMIMTSGKLMISPLTVHIPIKEVPLKLNVNLIKNKIIIINNSLVSVFGIIKPAIALLALNPHAGDNGLTGIEDKTVISRAIRNLRNIGFNVSGPFPADGFFGSGAYRKYDITAGMYHDQALIPFKILSLKKGVNFTAGIPIIRTSPAHGTAFDIAGKGTADIGSSVEAIKLSVKLSVNSHK
jgi:4-hydroxythreonine-4-phosphate dehydrogenase